MAPVAVDARLMLALRRLVITPMYFLSSSLGQLAPGLVSVVARMAEADTYIVSVVTWLLHLFLAAAGGGMGLLLLTLPWSFLVARDTSKLARGAAIQLLLRNHPHSDRILLIA
jgi:hypothetical protein